MTAEKHKFVGVDLSIGYDERLIIEDMNVTIPEGKVTVLIGSNGCGKSTLLKGMARLLKPKNGSFLLDGQSIREYHTTELAKKLGLLPQSPIVPAGITVQDLVARGRYPYRRFFSQLTKEDYQAIEKAMDAMEITHLADRHVDELSGGQRQRVWIALALAQQTDILLLDEPTTYLDIAHQVQILDCMKRLNREEGTTIAVILHDINLSIRYADHILAMKEGRLVAEGKPEDIITPELMKEVYDLDCIVIKDPETGLPFIIPKAQLA